MDRIAKGCVIGCSLAGVVAVTLLIGVAVLLVRACRPRSPAALANSALQIEFPEGTRAITNNNEASWLPLPGGASDGQIWMVLEVPPEQVPAFTNALAMSLVWHRLPL